MIEGREEGMCWNRLTEGCFEEETLLQKFLFFTEQAV